MVELPDGRVERLARAGRLGVAVCYGGLLAAGGLALAVSGGAPGAWLLVALVVALGVALVLERAARGRVTARQAASDATFARLLQGLARSVSPDAVVSTIVEELRGATGADHVVVTRARPADRLLEATLFSAARSVAPSTTYLPADLLRLEGLRTAEGRVGIAVAGGAGLAGGAGGGGAGPAGGGGAGPAGGTGPADLERQLVAERIADRLRDAYGLRNLLAVPLVADGTVIGSLTLSRRIASPWPATVRDLLDAAAIEVGAALMRVYAFQAAEARASLDGLTGLPNRRHFDELTRVLTPGRRRADGLGLLMIDIDHFKRLNDRYGHLVGDDVLRAVAHAIAASVRGDDTPARYGGEEFAVVLRRATLDQAVEVAERIRRSIGALTVGELGTLGVEAPVTVSIGVAMADDRTPTLEALVEQADRALFRAKRSGRDRVVVQRRAAEVGAAS